MGVLVVRANAKIHILKQFTTQTPIDYSQPAVVRANAKIHILKQFTTKVSKDRVQKMLYVLMQRYTF